MNISTWSQCRPRAAWSRGGGPGPASGCTRSPGQTGQRGRRSRAGASWQQPGQNMVIIIVIIIMIISWWSLCHHLDAALDAANVESGGRHNSAKLSLTQQLCKLQILTRILELLVDLINDYFLKSLSWLYQIDFIFITRRWLWYAIEECRVA